VSQTQNLPQPRNSQHAQNYDQLSKTSLNPCPTIDHNNLKQGCATYARIQK